MNEMRNFMTVLKDLLDIGTTVRYVGRCCSLLHDCVCTRVCVCLCVDGHAGTNAVLASLREALGTVRRRKPSAHRSNTPVFSVWVPPLIL